MLSLFQNVCKTPSVLGVETYSGPQSHHTHQARQAGITHTKSSGAKNAAAREFSKRCISFPSLEQVGPIGPPGNDKQHDPDTAADVCYQSY